MPTTALGVWTPNDSDAVDFTTDLATMAGTIDTAIANSVNGVAGGANAFKGTAAQRAAYLTAAPAGTMWRDTDGIRMIWAKDGAAWVPAVWRWGGTSAQRTGFTQAPVGFTWFDTTEGNEYVMLGGGWLKSGVAGAAVPFGASPGAAVSLRSMEFRSGRVSGTTSASGVLTVTFSPAFPTACVALIPMPTQNTSHAVQLVEGSQSASQGQLFFPGAASVARAMNWIAIGY